MRTGCNSDSLLFAVRNKAFDYYKKAAERGHALACTALGEMYHAGEGGEVVCLSSLHASLLECCLHHYCTVIISESGRKLVQRRVQGRSGSNGQSVGSMVVWLVRRGGCRQAIYTAITRNEDRNGRKKIKEKPETGALVRFYSLVLIRWTRRKQCTG